MELTKKDQRQIEHDADAIIDHIVVSASEYAHLYEIKFYEALKQRIDRQIDAKEYVHEYFRNRKTGENN
jgi:anaerobic ribonucleoside-triphosphate reductase